MKALTPVLAAVTLTISAGAVQALSLNQLFDTALDPVLADASSNYRPQGLGYDEATGELLYAQQSTRVIYKTDQTGALTGSVSLPTVSNINPNNNFSSSGFNHVTSVAADANGLYVSDYTCNASCADLYKIARDGSSGQILSSEVAAYGGYPIDVRNGMLYRTNNSTTYNWSNLTEVRISSLADPDTIDATVTLFGANGIADIAVDYERGEIWTLDYAAGASIRRFDLATGFMLDEFALSLDGLTAGLTFADDKLFYYDWNSGTGSRLQAFEIGGYPDAPQVPVPAAGLLLLTALGSAAALRRKRA